MDNNKDFIYSKNAKTKPKQKNKPSFYVVLVAIIIMLIGSVLGSFAFVENRVNADEPFTPAYTFNIDGINMDSGNNNIIYIQVSNFPFSGFYQPDSLVSNFPLLRANDSIENYSLRYGWRIDVFTSVLYFSGLQADEGATFTILPSFYSYLLGGASGTSFKFNNCRFTFENNEFYFTSLPNSITDYLLGFDEGKAEGLLEGFDNGYQVGYDVGYGDGYYLAGGGDAFPFKIALDNASYNIESANLLTSEHYSNTFSLGNAYGSYYLEGYDNALSSLVAVYPDDYLYAVNIFWDIGYAFNFSQYSILFFNNLPSEPLWLYFNCVSPEDSSIIRQFRARYEKGEIRLATGGIDVDPEDMPYWKVTGITLLYAGVNSNNGILYNFTGQFDYMLNGTFTLSLNSVNQSLADAYQSGYNAGLAVGEASGYNHGAEAAGTYTFLNLISSVVDAPIKAFSGLFNFKVFEVDLAPFFYFLLTLAVTFKIVSLLL